jgi:phosphate:Na+ symporter
MRYLLSIIYITGGLALFLFGVQESSSFFRSSMGDEFRDRIGQFTAGECRSFSFGVLLSAITQSSTIATSFAVGFVDAGMLSFAGSIFVMMGASLGGTFVSFLLSLNLFDYAPLLFAFGFFFAKSKRRCVWITAGLVRCLALIFLGMLLIGQGTAPLFRDGGFTQIVMRWAANPFIMGIIAFLGAGVLQSSSAIMALGITLAQSNALPAASALPIALGAHIGSTTMVVLAGLGGRLSAKRLGIATFFYKLIGGLIFAAFTPLVHRWMAGNFSVANELVFGQVFIAVFNIIIFLPFTSLLSTLSVRLISGEGDLGQPKYLDDEMLSVPFIAVQLLSKEMARLSNYLEAYLQMLFEPQQRVGREKLFDSLPSSIDELSEACQQYTYKVRVPGGNEELRRQFTSISNTMSILRGMSKVLCGGIRDRLITDECQKTLEARLGHDVWERWAKLSRKMMRTCLRAFVIGENGLIHQTNTLLTSINEMSGQIRRDLGEAAYDRGVSRTIRLISLMQSFLGMTKILAEDECDAGNIAEEPNYEEKTTTGVIDNGDFE